MKGLERVGRYRRRTRRAAGAFLCGLAVFAALFWAFDGQNPVWLGLAGVLVMVLVARAIRSARLVSWLGVATVSAVMIGGYGWSHRVLARYPAPTMHSYRMDDYRLAWQIRRRVRWSSQQVAAMLASIEREREQHPERLPELAVAEMQLWRRALEARVETDASVAAVLERWSRRDWVAEVRPALARTVRDVHEICGTRIRFLYRPLLAISCRHEDRHLEDIERHLHALAGARIAGWPRFDPLWVADLERQMNRHSRSPLVHDLVVREAVGFFKVAMKLHLWRRFAWIGLHPERPLPPDPFHPQQAPLVFRDGEMRSVARVRFRLKQGAGA